MSDERIASLEEKIEDLTGVMNIMVRTVNQLIQATPRGRRAPPGGEGSDTDDSTRSAVAAYRQVDKHLKIDIPDFSGSLNPDKLLEWLRDVERAFEYKSYNDFKAFKVATLKLKGYASLWYETLKNQRAKEGKEPIRSWSKLKKKLMGKFVTKDYSQDVFIQMSKLKQDDQPVESYLRKFEQLTLQCEITEKPEQKIARFLEGLNERIAEKVRMQPLWSFDNVVNLSLKVEKMGKTKVLNPKATPKLVQTKTYHGARIGETPKPTTNPALDKGKMPTGQKTSVTPKEDKRKCFQCQGYGHLRKECPSKRTLYAIEVEAWENEGLVEYELEETTTEDGAVEEGSSQDMIAAPPDTGHNLVLWRVMQSQQVPLEEDQRSLIFRSRCTIQERVCNLIIDGGSCTNVDSTTMVNKLKLSTQDHPTPYKLRLLNREAEVKVDKQCLVPFSIGNVYKD
ncbi:hypothetical protein RND81_04G050900 [Saponaria officinalis]|uniref:CCHC-type domain-containing protein n=1 Tax=Saponaria officinalis TaxID=3572 RepID=A0AAW1LI38_SAPOF